MSTDTKTAHPAKRWQFIGLFLGLLAFLPVEKLPAQQSGDANAQPAQAKSSDTAEPEAVVVARLQKKAEAVVAGIQKQLNNGRLPQEIIDRVQKLDSLMEGRKYNEAEVLLDSVLGALGVDPKPVLAAGPAPEAKKNPAPSSAAGSLSEFDPAGFTKIFDGKTLKDWDGDPQYWTVEDGKLVGTVTPETLLEKNSWIVWRGGLVEDFELVLDYRVSSQGNSGVGYRLAVLADDPFSVRGPQADIHGENMFTGICYEENGRRLLAARGQSTWIDDPSGEPRLIAQIADPEELQGLIRKGEWNRYRLVVKGNDAKHLINGVMMSEVHDHDETQRMHQGLVGVQVHVGPPMKIEYRDICLKHLGPQPEGNAGRDSVVYQRGSLLEREHAPTFENLVRQTARLTAPASDTPVNDQKELTIVTRDLGLVRHDLNDIALDGESKLAVSDEKRYDLVVISGEQTIRVPAAGHLLIGKPLDREYRVRMKWDDEQKHYEVLDLTGVNQGSGRPSAEYKAPLEFRGEPADAPVILAGTPTTPMFAMDACAIRDEEGYHLFYSSLFVETPSGLSPFWNSDLPYEGNIAKLVTAIAYAFSPDRGLTWEFRESPVLTPGDHEWENFRVETANAIVNDNTLHLFYCADGDRNGEAFHTRYQIGVVSMPLNDKSIRENLMDEHRVFSRTRTTPLLPYVTDKASYRNNVQEPTILYDRDQDRFELFFTGLKWKLPGEAVNHPDQQISGLFVGRAVLNKALEVEQVANVPMPHMINIIEVRKFRGQYHLFGIGMDNKSIICTTSADGKEWSEPTTVIGVDVNSSFASFKVASPTVVVDGDRLVLFYSGMSTSPQRSDDRWAAQAGETSFLSVNLCRAVSTGGEANRPAWLDEVQTYGMLPLFPEDAKALHVSVNGVWAGIGGTHPILPDTEHVPAVRQRYGDRAADFVKDNHVAGLRVCAAVNGLEGMVPLREVVPNFDAMACRKADGNPAVMGEGMTLMCTNNPDWVRWEFNRGKQAIDEGADLILLDTPMSSSFISGFLGAGFCDHCMSTFEKHLAAKYEASEMHDALGFTDFDKERIIERLRHLQKVTPMEESPYVRDTSDARLFREFISAQEEASFRTRKELLTDLRSHADRQGGRVAFATNAADLETENPGGHWIRGIMFADLVDLFAYEQNSDPTGAIGGPLTPLPRGKWAAFHKLAHAIHGRRSPAVIHAGNMGQLLMQVVGEQKSINTWMAAQVAEAYAANGAYIVYQIGVPGAQQMLREKCWAGAAAQNEFILSHRDLYAGDLRSGSPLAFLFLYNERGRTIPAVFPSYLGLAQGFIETNHPYDVVFAGDGHYVRDQLDGSELGSYNTIVVPSPIQPTENQKRVVQKFARSGGVVVCQEPELLGLAGETTRKSNDPDSWWVTEFAVGKGKVIVLSGDVTRTGTSDVGSMFYQQNSDKLRHEIAAMAKDLGLKSLLNQDDDGLLSAFPVMQPEEHRLVVHLVNYDIDPVRDAIRPKENVRLSIPAPEFLSETVRTILYQGDAQAVDLDATIAEGTIRVTVPVIQQAAVIVVSGEE